MACICLVSPSNIAANPRLVKEADALHEAGFLVRVVAGDDMQMFRSLDRPLAERGGWQWEPVRRGTLASYALRTLHQRLARQVWRWGMAAGMEGTARAYHRTWDRLARVAAKEPADLYLAHNLPALPAVAIAARQHGAKFGFDAEDYHPGELLERPENTLEIALRDRLERLLLPKCVHRTAASPDIARAYRDGYGLEMLPILNVFPLADAPQTPQPLRNDRPPKLYWFSQTLGPGRGLEAILDAIALMATPVELHARGNPAAGYAESLQQRACQHGIGDRLHLLPLASPEAMIALAADCDLGLSLELNTPPHRALCLTNKLFTYLLAGIPVAMSRTPAQDALAQHLGAAALTIDLQQPAAIAAEFDRFFAHPNREQQARDRAWQLGRERYNWDVEKVRFLAAIEKALSKEH